MTHCLFVLLVGSFSFFVFAQEEPDPFDVQLGEKLFSEDRFSQSFFSKSGGDVNGEVAEGDPIFDRFETPGGPLQHPHSGKQVSCASCHFVDQVSEFQENLVFTYNDFSPRSLIPQRADKAVRTLRNSMNMVLSGISDGAPLHWDGEFYSVKDLSCASLVGRNMGWLNTEAQEARQHIVQVIRQDSGTYPTASDLKESYEKGFLRLGADLTKMTDKQVFSKTCELLGRYIKSLDFSRDEQGQYNLSAYDQFLKLNGIRRGPRIGESIAQYLVYLKDQLNFKIDWKWLAPEPLKYHSHGAEFGPKELQGMQTFFKRGQCASCHTPPSFTNALFHSTGISQFAYDKVHGAGAFVDQKIPTWKERHQDEISSFTGTEEHPMWRGAFAQIPLKQDPNKVDLGAWNVLGHPDKPSVQKPMRETLCRSARMPRCDEWSDDRFLSQSLASFKTPTTRGLGQSAPYFHDGSSDTLMQVLQVYKKASEMSRRGLLRNADPMLRAMRLEGSDFEPLILFMESLDEDYD